MKTSTLKSAIEFAINTLSQFARELHFWQKFEVAFGQKYNRVRAKEIYQAAVDGTFILPIRILDDQLMSMAVGAFSATTDTIYLKSSFVSGGDVAAIGAVILEELGHAIDAQVNRVETPGDEGAIFSLLVCGGEIAADLLAKLRAEDDWGQILVDGQELMVEMAVINGSDDPEDLIGTIDSDLINALGGDDTINSGFASIIGDGYGGSTTVTAGSVGQDSIDGGDGTDTLLVDYSANVNTNGGSARGIRYEQYDSANGSGRLIAYRADNSIVDIIQYSNIEKLNITGTQYADNIRGSNGDDTLIGGAGNDTIDGGAGSNTIDGGEGIDTLLNINFSAEATNLSIVDTGATITSPSGSNISNIENLPNVTTGSGDDSINFTRGDNNAINTGGGNDTVDAGLGQDIVDGGSETDTLIIDYSANVNTNGGSARGIRYEQYDSANGSGRLIAYRADNSIVDIIQYSNIEKLNITGTQYADNIRGSNGDDTLIGGAGNDTIDGGAGNNTIDGGVGDDLITVNNSSSITSSLVDGGVGTDTLINANFSAATTGLFIDSTGTTIIVNDSTISNVENFANLSTGSGNDFISLAQMNNNVINTGGGNDTVDAGLGQDTVDGGSGTDTLIIDYSVNVNTNGGSARGIRYEQYDSANGSGRLIAYRADNSIVDIIQYSNIEKLNITGTQYADNIRGGNGDDTFIGGAGNDTIDAGTGNDIINGINLGRASNNGTGEIDSLRGGAGSDRFILGNSINSYYDDQSISTSGSNDYALIADFNPNEDRIQLHGAVSDYRLEISGTNTNLYIDRAATEPDELIGVFQNITGLDLASTAFQYVAAINNISFSANTYNLSEGNLAQITLYRLGDNIGQNSITLNLTNGSATATADYVNTPIVVTFNDGESSKIVDIPIVDDLILENTENLLITLANPTNGATIGTDSQANLIIADNEINQAITLTNSNPVVVSNVFLNTANRNKVPSEIIYTVTNTPDTGVLSLDSNQALSFSSGNYVGNYETFASIQDNFTMEFWVNPTATRTVTPESNSGISGLNSGQSYVIGPLQGSPSSNVNAGVSVGTNGVSVFEHRSGYLPSTLVHNTNISGWNHVAIVYNNKQPSLYLNGQFVKAGLTSSYIVHPSALLGGLVSYGPFQGELDDVRIWNVARTPAEIQSNYNQALLGNEAGLSGYWNFSNVTGNIARDATANAHDGNIIGATAVSSPILSSFNPLQVGATFTQADINSGKLSYKPNPGVSGQDSFIFSVSDGSSTVANQTFNFINSPSAILSFSQPTYSVSEDGTTSTSITVTRTGGTLDAVSANVILSNGTAITTTDFNGDPITVTFAAGDTAPKTIIVPIADDPLFEGDETVNLTLANLTGGAVLGLQNTAVLTITNNDLPQPGTLSFASNNYNVNENGVPNVTVVRSGGSNGVVTIDIALANGTAVAPNDYNNIPISISFADGEISKVVELSSLINDDTIYEQPETIALALFQPTGGATIGSQSTTTLSIVDNDAAPGTVQFSTTSYSVAEDGSAFAAITLVRTDGADGSVSVQVNSTDGTAIAPADYLNGLVTVSFANGEVSKTVVIPIVDDTTLEISETINLTLINPQGGVTLGSQNTATLTIVDNESPSLRVSIDQSAIAENGTVIATVVRNTNDISSELVVNLASDDVQQATVPNTITILAGQSSATFAVTGVDDGLNDGSKPVIITATATGLVSGAKSLQITDINIPDLVITVDTISAPASASLGELITVNWQVENISTIGPAAADWNDYVYISTDDVYSPDDVLVGTRSASANSPLGMNGVYTGTANVTLNNLNLLGDRHLIVVADGNGAQVELNETNNARSKAIQVQAADLNAKSIVVTGQNLGGSADITWTVENTGNGAATKTRRDLVYLSRTSILGNDAVLLVSRDVSISIAAGATHTETATVNLPLDPSYNSGNYYFILKTDSLNGQIETDETDNTKVEVVALTVPPTPNLVVENVLLPGSETSGNRIPISWDVKNTGTADIVGKTWKETVYLSTDNIAGNSDDIVFDTATLSNISLAVGASLPRQREITLPIDYQGQRWLVVKTDVDNSIYEHTGESDNSSISTAPIDITLSLFPNLQVTSIIPPSDSFSGASTIVSWQVTNTGGASTSSPYWYDQVWLSQDGTLDIDGDYQLATIANPSFLAPGTSYNSSATVQIPRGLDNSLNQGWRFIIKTDAGAFRTGPSVYEYDKEDDNIMASTPFPITTTPPPDLRVTSVIVAPSSPFSGQKATVTWAVENRGTGRTLPSETKWTDELFLAKNADGSGESYSLGRFEHQGGLTELDLTSDADRYTNTQIVDLPIGKWGDYFFVVNTDVGHTVFEQAFEGNNSGFLDANTQDSIDTPTQIKLTPPPDLTVLNVSSTANAVAGKKIDVAYRVTNDGTTGVPARTSRWTDSFFLSTTANFDPNTALLIGQKSYDNQGLVFDTGAIYNSNATLTIPKELAAGNYYVFAYTDRSNEVFEQDDVDAIVGGIPIAFSNLKSTAQPITIVSRPADLVVTNANAIGTLNAGKVGRFTWTVLNQGTGDSNATTWNDQLILSRNAVAGDGDDYSLATIRRDVGVLPVGGTYTRTEDITLPFALIGDYNLFVTTDSSNDVYEADKEGNNSSIARPININRLTPDLETTAVSSVATAVAGSDISISWNVKNIGEGLTNADYWYDSVYLSADENLNISSDTLLGIVRRNGNLTVDNTYTGTAGITLPKNIQGEYYLIAAADTDARYQGENNRVLEISEVNNLATTAINIAINPVPDLLVTAVDAAATGISGQDLDISWTVINNKPTAIGASEEWRDSVYLSRDRILDRNNGDVFLGSIKHNGGLSGNSSYTENTRFDIPRGLSGAYYIFVATDDSYGTSRIEEREGEQNNISYDSIATQIIIAPPADLAPIGNSIIFASTGVAGELLTVNYQVQNKGGDTALGRWTDTAYLSKDDVWDLNDAVLGSFEHGGDVLPNGTYSGNITAKIPGVVPGDYRVIVRSDVRDGVPDTDITNDTVASISTTYIDFATLTVGGSTISSSLAQGQAVYYKFQGTAGTAVRLKLDSVDNAGANGLYVKYGDVPTRGQFDRTDTNPFNPDPDIIVPIGQDGTYYVMAYGNSVSGAPNYTINATEVPFSISNVETKILGNVGKASIKIEGALFEEGTTFQLIDNAGNVVNQLSDKFKDSTVDFATFDLTGKTAGKYDLRATQANGASTIVDDVITVQNGIGFSTVSAIDGPEAVWAGTKYPIAINYGNSGDTDGAAPLVIVRADDKAAIGLSPRYENEQQRNKLVQIFGAGNDINRSTLRPQESHSVPVYFTSLASAELGTVGGVGVSEYTIYDRNLISDNDWILLRDSSRPSDLSKDQWNAFWQSKQSGIGNSWGDYVKLIHNLSDAYGQQDANSTNVSQLFQQWYQDTAEDSFHFVPKSSISGRLLDENGNYLANQSIDLYKINADGAQLLITDNSELSAQRVITDSNGFFVVSSVEPGEYKLSIGLGDRYFKPVDNIANFSADMIYRSIQVLEGSNVSNLDITTYPKSGGSNSKYDFQAGAKQVSILKDASGVSHLFWLEGNSLWHSYNSNGQWVDAAPINDITPGARYSVKATDGLADETPGIVITWDRFTDSEGSSDIQFAFGRSDKKGGFEWSNSQVLTNTEDISDTNPDVLFTQDNKPLIVYQKSKIVGQDDTDIYFDEVSIPNNALTWSSPQLKNLSRADFLTEDSSSAQSVGFSIGGGIEAKLPVPIFGFSSFKALYAGFGNKTFNCDRVTDQRGWNARGEFGKKNQDASGKDISGTKIIVGGGGSSSATWVRKSRTGPYVLDSARNSLNVNFGVESFDVLDKLPAPISATLALINRVSSFLGQGSGVEAGLYGNISFAASASTNSAGVSSYSKNGNLGLGGFIKFKLAGGSDPKPAPLIEVKGSLGGFGSLTETNRPDGTSYSGRLGARAQIEVKVPTVKLNEWFKFDGFSASAFYQITIDFPSCQTTVDTSQQQSSLTSDNLSASSGTTDVYGNNAVSINVSQDVYNDGAPILVKGVDGKPIMTWIQQGSPEEGNHIVVSKFDGTQWTEPTQVAGGGLISGLDITTSDIDGRSLVVWTMVDPNFRYSQTVTNLDEFKILMEVAAAATNTYYSTQEASGNWSAPILIKDTPGADSNVHFGKTVNGEIVLSWLNKSNNTTNLLISFWNGVSWTNPIAVASGNISQASIGEIDGKTVAFWSQRNNFEPSDNRFDEQIRYSNYDANTSQWSASTIFSPTLALGGQLFSNGLIDLPGGADDPGNPPAECPCKTDSKTYCPPVRQSSDPNDILGPDGYGAEKWTTAENPFDYIIRFENMATATAPAKIVTVIQQLDADLDWRSFRLGSFNWGDISIQAPENSAFFSERIDLVSKYGVFVDVSASIDVRTGIASWELRSIDPTTGDTPIDPLKGFLPPNDPNNLGVGEGNVSYYIKAKSTVTTGTRIDAEARIIFDTNEAIDTPKIFNTLDVEKPISSVNVLPTQSINPEFQISWTGDDETAGSGIAGYNVYGAIAGEEYELIAEGITDKEITFLGEVGTSYNFYTLAVDNAGNIQEIATSIPATISIGGPGVISFTAAEYSVNESGAAIAAVTVQRTNGSLGAISATVDFNGGTASGGAQPFYAGLDYDNTSILVNFADGETSKVITIPINNDTLAEGNETVRLALSNITGGATLGDRAAAQLTIVDESIQLNFSRTNFRVNENGTAVNEIQINRVGRTDIAVGATVSFTDITATSESDYTATPIQVDFAAGETTKTLVIPVSNDTLAEGDETIRLQLSNPTNGAAIGSNGQAVLTIVDDETNLKFNITAESGINTQAVAGFTAAANNWSKTLSNNATINISVVFQDLGVGTLGQSVAERANYSYTDVYTALSNGRRSADDFQSVASLQTGTDFDLLINRTTNNPNGNGSITPYSDNDADANNSTIRLNRANAKALGLVSTTASGNDATLIFNSNSGLQWDFDPTNGISAGSYDFIGLATHELAHSLGFESGVDVVDTNAPASDNEYTYVSALDLFRFSTASSAQGAIDFTASNTDKYFSLDGGITKIASFATGVNNGDGRQPQHWKDGLGLGLLDPTVAPGERLQIAELDKRAFDVIGWNVVGSLVPNTAPTAVTLMNTVTTLAEDINTATHLKIADINVTDDALGTNNLMLSGADADLFEIDGNAIYIKAGTALNFEAQSSYAVTVAVDDPTVGNTPDALTNFILSITDVNEAPTALTLASTVTTLAENSNVATRLKVANINVVDDAIGTNTLSLSGGDAGNFEIIGSELYIKAGTTLDFETKPNYAVTVVVNDATVGVTANTTTTFNLTLTDVFEATGVINGTNAADNIPGTAGNDTINGLDGNDTIRAGMGNDIISGGNNNDDLYGDEGNDTIDGGSGADNIYGGSGQDSLIGGLGIDYIDGGDNNDIIEGGYGNDNLYGGNGNDRLLGGSDNDYIDGGASNDYIDGENGNDNLTGGYGVDTVYGGLGDDTVNGGVGTDIDALFGGAGVDTFALGKTAADRIGDFATSELLQISAQSFGGGLVRNVALQSNQLSIGVSNITATTRFIYNNGDLFFDADGSEVGAAAIKIATLDGSPSLSVSNFSIVR